MAVVITLLIISGILVMGGGIYYLAQETRLSAVESKESILKEDSIEELSANFPDFKTLELEIRTTKDSYYVGESLFGSEYYLEYEGEPFSGVILYGKSAEGLFKTTYNKFSGIIKTGNFNDSQHLKILKAPMYSVKIDGTPNPSFECDLNYIYSMSVYGCKDIEDALGVGNCGETVFKNFDIEEEVAKIPALKTVSKTIPAICPEEKVSCCTNHAFACTTSTSKFFRNRCKEGYICEAQKKCIPF